MHDRVHDWVHDRVLYEGILLITSTGNGWMIGWVIGWMIGWMIGWVISLLLSFSSMFGTKKLWTQPLLVQIIFLSLMPAATTSNALRPHCSNTEICMEL